MVISFFCSVVNLEYASEKQFYRWIRITHVCRYWRNAALGTPALWSTILLGSASVARIKAFTARSKPHPLHVLSVWHVATQWDALLSVIERELPRIKSFTIHFDQNNFKILDSVFSAAAPPLRILKIQEIDFNDPVSKKLPILYFKLTSSVLDDLTLVYN